MQNTRAITIPDSMRLTTVITLTLAGTFLASFALVAALFVNAAQRQARQEAVREARMIMAAGVAARNYTDQQIKPLLPRLASTLTPARSLPWA